MSGFFIAADDIPHHHVQLHIPTIHDQLRAARRKRRITRADAAAHIGVAASSIGHWERERMPPFDKVVELARLYGVSLDSLAGLS